MLANAQKWFDKMGHKISRWVGDEKSLNATQSTDRNTLQSYASHHVLSHLLPYETYDPESSLFVNKKSCGFMLEATTIIGSSEETENILASFITDSLPSTVDVQFLLWASPKIGPILDAFEQVRSNHDIVKWLSKKRTEFLKRGAYESLSRYGSYLIRNFRLFIVVSQATNNTDRFSELIALRDDLVSALRSINIASHVVGADEFISLLSDFIAPKHSIYPTVHRWNEFESLSQQIADSEWNIEVKPNALLFSSENEKVEARCLSVREFPQKATQWKMTENLGQLFNSTLQIPCPFLVSFSLRKIEQDKAVAQAQLKFMNRESTAKSSLAKFKPSIGQEYEDWQFIRHRLSEGDCLVKTFYQIILFSSPEDANHCERRLRDLYRANGWKLRKESFLQFQSWLSSLPMMITEGLFDDLKTFGRLRTMTAFNAINVAPLQGEWKGTKTASLILPGRRGQVATWLPFDNPGGNYNMAIAAASGRGKSVFTQEYIVSILGQGGMVWVIDVGRSYEKTCQLLGGEFIQFKREKPLCLNPFTTVIDITQSLEVLKPLFATMARPMRGATEEELSYIEQGILASWETKGQQATVTDVVEWFKAQQDVQAKPICQGLATVLFPYTKEGMYGKFFEGAATINFSNPLVVLELQELKNKKDLQRIILLLLIYQIGNSLFFGNRERIKTCIIDEAWSLLDGDDPQTARFIETGYRTARRFRGNFVTITQSIADYYKNAMSRAAFECSDFKVILGQTEEAINKIKQENIMDLDGFTERLFKSLKVTPDFSECIIKSDDGLSVHRIILDPYSRILFSTKGEEFEAVKQLVDAGISLTCAVEQVAR